MRCIITDDEPFARKGLQGYVEKVDFLQLVGVCEDALQLNTLLKTQSADLLLLDIEMPYLSGIDFLRSLSPRPLIIFTTAYEQYALQGFELDVVDYLVKPIPFERFLRAVNKACDRLKAPEPTGADYLFVKVEDALVRLRYAAIQYLEARENYVLIHTAEGRMLVHSTLKALVEQLPARQFVQCHKSFVVNSEAVQQIEGNQLLIGTARVPVSKYLREEVLNRIINNQLLRK